MTGLDWGVAVALLGLGGPLLIWAINKIISERLMDFSEKLTTKLDNIKDGLKNHLDNELADIREAVQAMDADMTKLAADVAVLAVRIKALEEAKETKGRR